MDSNEAEFPAPGLHKTLASSKDSDLEEATQLATENGADLAEMLEGVVSKEEVYQCNCFKVLLLISKGQPLALYPGWDHFVALLGSSNAYHRLAAVNIIAHLAAADAENRFDDLFDRHFDLLDDQSVVVARYAARNAGKIARSRRPLQKRVAQRLLRIDEAHRESAAGT